MRMVSVLLHGDVFSDIGSTESGEHHVGRVVVVRNTAIVRARAACNTAWRGRVEAACAVAQRFVAGCYTGRLYKWPMAAGPYVWNDPSCCNSCQLLV